MTTVGFATLDVIPSMKGTRASLEKQVAGDFAAVGKSSGAKLGTAAGTSAAASFGKAKGRFLSEAKAMAAPLAGIFAGAAVVNFFGDSIAEAREAGKVSRITAQEIEATGGAANLTAREVSDLAKRMMEYAAVDDDVVQAGENVLLTFKNVRNEIGEGNDVFDRATKVGLDLSTVMGGDVTGAARQLGRALNDPVKGLTALARAGVQFSEDQQNQIKALVAQNDLLGAQKIVLGEVESQLGGTAGAAVDNTQRMSVAFGELEESVGGAALPVIEGFSKFMVDEGIPALEATGGAVSDVVGFIDDLPGPVKAAAGAFIILKAASALDLGGVIGRGRSAALRGLDDIRLRTMLATQGYRDLRRAEIVAQEQGFKFNQGSGRIVAGIGAIKGAASGAGTALKRGLGGALGLVGGPWGVAFLAGTAVLTHFWQESREAKARVDELTDSLNEQTGAITKQTKETAFKNLQDSGALDLAKKYRISLTDIRDAALGNVDAQARVNAELETQQAAFAEAFPAMAKASGGASELSIDFGHLKDAIGTQNDELDAARDGLKDHTDFMAKDGDEQDRLTVKVRDYGKKIRDAKDALKDLIDAEQTRADNAVRTRRDQLGLITTIKDAEKEARKGKQTLDENTAAGRNNLGALLDLADQWNNSTPKVQNARGAYKNLRDEFIKLADQMNGPDGTKKDAEKLADSLLKLPKHVPIEFQSKGFKERMAEIAQLKAAAQHIGGTVDFDPLRPDKPAPRRPSSGGGGNGGSTSGRGTVVNNTYNLNTIKDAEAQDLHKRQQVAMGGFG